MLGSAVFYEPLDAVSPTSSSPTDANPQKYIRKMNQLTTGTEKNQTKQNLNQIVDLKEKIKRGQQVFDVLYFFVMFFFSLVEC